MRATTACIVLILLITVPAANGDNQQSIGEMIAESGKKSPGIFESFSQGREAGARLEEQRLINEQLRQQIELQKHENERLSSRQEAQEFLPVLEQVMKQPSVAEQRGNLSASLSVCADITKEKLAELEAKHEGFITRLMCSGVVKNRDSLSKILQADDSTFSTLLEVLYKQTIFLSQQ